LISPRTRSWLHARRPSHHRPPAWPLTRGRAQCTERNLPTHGDVPTLLARLSCHGEGLHQLLARLQRAEEPSLLRRLILLQAWVRGRSTRRAMKGQIRRRQIKVRKLRAAAAARGGGGAGGGGGGGGGAGGVEVEVDPGSAAGRRRGASAAGGGLAAVGARVAEAQAAARAMMTLRAAALRG
jgi:hypothetical protein